MSGPPVGWILAIGSLVDPADPLVRRLAATGGAAIGGVAIGGVAAGDVAAGGAVPLRVEGLRRRWTAGMENRAAENDGKHYLDADGGRPDVCVVSLSADEGVGALTVLALPVDADGLARADRRERRYVRREVSDRCSVRLDGPAWVYTARDDARARAAAAADVGRAVVRRGYVAGVEAAFRARGPEAWRAYRASTDPPPHPLADLTLVRPGVPPGE